MLHRRRFLQGSSAAIAAAATLRLPGPGWAAGEAVEKRLYVHSEVPMNAEPALGDLVKSWMTPLEHFYVRSHAPVPEVDETEFRLSVEGLVHQPLTLSMDQLRTKYPKQSVIATMTCAGNRRSEHSLVKEVKGVAWRAGAIGNARWTGTPLSAVLKQAVIKEGAKHVWFEGVDRVDHNNQVIPFGASIPLEKALTDTEAMPGTLLTYEMNDRPLPPNHGFPLRTVVPGYIGARSVKWLGRIVVSDRPSPNHYVATAYKLVTEGTDAEWAAATPLYEYPLNSVLCVPAAGAELKAGKVKVQGYTLAPGFAGRTVARVELSSDGGRTWTRARFREKPQPFCWRLWETEIRLPQGQHELIVRATDSAGTTQPQRVDWNLKGYMFNAWHRTPVTVES